MDSEWIALLGIVLGILGIFNQQIIFGLIRLRQKYIPSDRGISGYWASRWEKRTDRPQSEVLRVQKTGRTIIGTVVFPIDRASEYRIDAKMIEEGVVAGTWENINGTHRGTLHFTVIESARAQGCWTGISSTDKLVKAGGWNMEKLPSAVTGYDLDFNRKDYQEALCQVIDRHELKYSSDQEAYETEVQLNKQQAIHLRMLRGVFDPGLGNVSGHLLHYLESEDIDAQDVLDMGCGCGFLTIYFSEYRKSKVTAVEINDRAYNCAKENIRSYDAKDKVELIEGNLYDAVYQWRPEPNQFDLIIANLPFSSKRNYGRAVRGYRFRDPQAKARYRSMFCAEGSLLFKLVLGARYYLKTNGRLIFPIGGSSDLKIISRAIALSGLKKGNPRLLNVCGEDILILDLEKTETPQ